MPKKIEMSICIVVYVVVQCYSWFNSIFLCFCVCMLMYDSEFRAKQNKMLTQDKTELQHNVI